jgi:hypothetical protein
MRFFTVPPFVGFSRRIRRHRGCVYSPFGVFSKAMTRLSASDLTAVLSFLEEAQAVEGPAPFTPELLDRLARVTRCEDAAFFEVDHPKRTLDERVTCSWAKRSWNGMPDDLWTCARTVELQRHKVANGPGPVVLSDVFSRPLRLQPDFNPNLS